jgi:hypothetical protein
MKINYSDKTWYLKLPDTEEEWDTLVNICREIGISFLGEKYNTRFTYLMPSGADVKELSRNCNPVSHLTEISFYKMIQILTSPKKSHQRLQIEQLENTIAQAVKEVNFLKTDIEV